MPPRDIQAAAIAISPSLLARALQPAPDPDVMNTLGALKDNTSPRFWSNMADEIEKAAREPAPPRVFALLECIDIIDNLAARGKISAEVYSADPDWLPDETIKALLDA